MRRRDAFPLPPSGSSMKREPDGKLVMQRKARKPRASKLIPGWTTDDKQLANLMLEEWEDQQCKSGRIVLGEAWKECFDALVNQCIMKRNFPGGGNSIHALTPDETYAQCKALTCTERLQRRIAHLRKEVQRMFEICCENLEKKRQRKTADILRRVRDGSILPLLRSESKAIWEEFQDYYPIDLRPGLKGCKADLDRDISRLQKKWRDKIDEEIQQAVREAKIELLKSRMQAQLSPLSEKNPTSVSQVSIPKPNGVEPAQPETADRVNVEGTAEHTRGNPPLKSRRGRRKGSGHQETRDLDDAIRDVKRDGQRTTTAILDYLVRRESVKPVPLPAGWHKKYGARMWKEVHSKAKLDQHLMDLCRKRFSKVRI